MKYIFLLLLLVHGLIHLMGFAKAFDYGNITQLTRTISRSAGLAWLLTGLLFILSAALLLGRNNWWLFIIIPAVIISQVLIIGAWKDARFGTIANMIVLLVAIPAYGNFWFQKMVRSESLDLLAESAGSPTALVSGHGLEGLPPIVKKWVTTAGIPGKKNIRFVRLEQKGEMRTRPGGKWMSFTAQQYFTPQQPAFVWNAKVELLPLVYLNGRDRLRDGKGEMQIKALAFDKMSLDD